MGQQLSQLKAAPGAPLRKTCPSSGGHHLLPPATTNSERAETSESSDQKREARRERNRSWSRPRSIPCRLSGPGPDTLEMKGRENALATTLEEVWEQGSGQVKYREFPGLQASYAATPVRGAPLDLDIEVCALRPVEGPSAIPLDVHAGDHVQDAGWRPIIREVQRRKEAVRLTERRIRHVEAHGVFVELSGIKCGHHSKIFRPRPPP